MCFSLHPFLFMLIFVFSIFIRFSISFINENWDWCRSRLDWVWWIEAKFGIRWCEQPPSNVSNQWTNKRKKHTHTHTSRRIARKISQKVPTGDQHIIINDIFYNVNYIINQRCGMIWCLCVALDVLVCVSECSIRLAADVNACLHNNHQHGTDRDGRSEIVKKKRNSMRWQWANETNVVVAFCPFLESLIADCLARFELVFFFVFDCISKE